jgi:hypothetical protein
MPLLHPMPLRPFLLRPSIASEPVVQATASEESEQLSLNRLLRPSTCLALRHHHSHQQRPKLAALRRLPVELAVRLRLVLVLQAVRPLVPLAQLEEHQVQFHRPPRLQESDRWQIESAQSGHSIS